MPNYHVGCCQHQQITLSTAQALTALTPRDCQCDYCQKQQLHYVSDPKGQVTLSLSAVTVETNGSAQAKFMRCNHCQTIIGAYIHPQTDHSDGLITLNADLWEPSTFASSEAVELAELTPQQKRSRWEHVLTPCTL